MGDHFVTVIIKACQDAVLLLLYLKGLVSGT